jgi:hypothetical protein
VALYSFYVSLAGHLPFRNPMLRDCGAMQLSFCGCYDVRREMNDVQH